MANAIANAFRDYNTTGSPGSGVYKPVKSVIRAAFAGLVISTLATAIVSIGDEGYAPETVTIRPNGTDVRFAISNSSMQLHHDNIVLGVGNGASYAPGITWKLPDHNSTYAGADHALFSIYCVENSSGLPYSAQFTGGRAGGAGQPLIAMAFYTMDSSAAAQLRLYLATGDNYALGVGTSAPSSSTQGTFLHLHNPTVHKVAWVHFTNGTTSSTGSDGAVVGIDDTEALRVWQYESNSIKFGTSNTLAGLVTLDRHLTWGPNAASFGIGATSNTVEGSGFSVGHVIHVARSSTSTKMLVQTLGTQAGASTQITFLYDTTTVGSISSTNSATAFNTSSDGRLKPLRESFDSGALIDATEVVRHNWIQAPDDWSYGVIAQDAIAVMPTAVTPGSGDPGDDDYMPWGVDYSKYVPVLLAETKSLRARVAALEAA